MSALGRSRRKIAISPITRFSANSSVDGGLEFAEITALVPFSTPTPVCDSLHPSARMALFCSFGIASLRPDPDAIAKPTSRTASPLN